METITLKLSKEEFKALTDTVFYIKRDRGKIMQYAM